MYNNKMSRPLKKTVIVFATTANGQKAIMTHRTKSDRGWDLICGGVKKQESIFNAAVREFNEEADPKLELGFSLLRDDALMGLRGAIYNASKHKLHFIVRGKIAGNMLPPTMPQTDETDARALVSFGPDMNPRDPKSFYRLTSNQLVLWRMRNIGEIGNTLPVINIQHSSPLPHTPPTVRGSRPLTLRDVAQMGIYLPILKGIDIDSEQAQSPIDLYTLNRDYLKAHLKKDYRQEDSVDLAI